jgi:hypothetical protein
MSINAVTRSDSIETRPSRGKPRVDYASLAGQTTRVTPATSAAHPVIQNGDITLSLDSGECTSPETEQPALTSLANQSIGDAPVERGARTIIQAPNSHTFDPRDVEAERKWLLAEQFNDPFCISISERLRDQGDQTEVLRVRSKRDTTNFEIRPDGLLVKHVSHQNQMQQRIVLRPQLAYRPCCSASTRANGEHTWPLVELVFDWSL